VAAPVTKPRRVRLGIDGVLVASMKPATAIHKVHRTTRIFMMYSPMVCVLPISPLGEGVQHLRVTFQSGKCSITARAFGQTQGLQSTLRLDIFISLTTPVRVPDGDSTLIVM